VRLDNGGSYLGQAQVTVVNSSTQITISPAITGLASGTIFSFITDVIGIAKAMVTVNGYDFQGNAITPVSWATTANALSYIRAGFAPTNVALHNAGSDGADIGAVALSSSVTFLVSPGNTDTVFEGAVRTVYGNVCSAVQSQGCTPPANVTIAWVASCGTLSSSSGPWVTWTAPNSTGTCTVTGTAAAGGS